MRTLCFLLLVTLVFAPTAGAVTKSIDAGRGDVPLTVPSSYDGAAATPLIVLLHGFGSSGAEQSTYMKLGELVDSYGFILATPDGTASEGEVFGMQSPRFWAASATEMPVRSRR